MNSQPKLLEVIDENENITGLENRLKIHQDRLLHREIHIFFLTPNGEIVFQHRAKDKDTYADKLDATVGGHVELNMSYEETAIKECEEETGIDIDPEKLIFLAKIKKKTFDEITGLTNNTIRSQYAYLFAGSINDLQIEQGKAEGFEAYKIDELAHLSSENRQKFIPILLTEDMLILYNKAKDTLLN